MSLPLFQALLLQRYLRKMEERLTSGQSILVEGPRYYGKESAVRSLAAGLRNRAGWTSVELSSRPDFPARNFDLAALKTQFFDQLKIPSPTEASSFEESIWQAMVKLPRPILITLRGGTRGNEINHFQLLAIFDRLLQRAQTQDYERLAVIALDDGSLSQSNESVVIPTDPFSFLKPILRLQPLSRADIVVSLTNLPLALAKAANADRELIATWLTENTGGHPGLLAELLNVWPTGEKEATLDALRPVFNEALEDSAVLGSLRHALQDDPEGLSRTALEYEQPQFPESQSPRVSLLSQLGVLHWISASERLSLCSGVITRLVKSVATRSRQIVRRVGTMVNENGPRLFLDEEVPIDDDTVVVLQLSDLHIGPEYRHAIRLQGSVANPEERTLGELLAEDLEKMELTGRIDAVVLSGDFVSNAANWDQFQRAHDIVEEILEATKVKRAQIILVPGNHDVNWKPGELTETINAQKVSMDNYDDFAKRLIGKRDPDSLRVVSRSKNVHLNILGLDSNCVEGPESGGIGFVSQDNYRAAQKKLANFGAVKRPKKGDKKPVQPVQREHLWIVVHHHLLPVIDFTMVAAKQRKVSVMANASLMLHNAVRWGAELVLHGHAHQPAITVTRRWPGGNNRGFSTLPVVACGSIGAKVEQLGPFARNQYFVIYRRKEDIILRSRSMDEQGVCFTAHNDVLLPQNAAPLEN